MGRGSVGTLLRRVVAGDVYRKSRLHDEKGNLLPLPELRHLPRNLYWTMRRRATGKLPDRPWLTFDAVVRLDGLIRSDWRMVEFGSGMSTLWFAERVASLHSIEHDPAWYATVAARLPAGVRYDLRGPSSYCDLADHPDGSLDLVVVDGIQRAECVRAAIPKLRPGGWLYLDNTDKDMTIPNGDLRRAEAALFAAVGDHGGGVEQRTGLTIGLVSSHQWTLAAIGGSDSGPAPTGDRPSE